MSKIPECKGYSSWTDCGIEYDCEYQTEVLCDECICTTALHNDFSGIDPRTGEKYKEK